MVRLDWLWFDGIRLEHRGSVNLSLCEMHEMLGSHRETPVSQSLPAFVLWQLDTNLADQPPASCAMAQVHEIAAHKRRLAFNLRVVR